MHKKNYLVIAFAGVLMIALTFALIPVQKAITVHSSITSNIDVQRILLNNINIDACPGGSSPPPPCVANAADTIELIPSGTFWKGTLCINNDGANLVGAIQLFADGTFKTVPLSNVAMGVFDCFNLGGNGLRITGASNNVDITLAFDKEG